MCIGFPRVSSFRLEASNAGQCGDGRPFFSVHKSCKYLVFPPLLKFGLSSKTKSFLGYVCLFVFGIVLFVLLSQSLKVLSFSRLILAELGQAVIELKFCIVISIVILHNYQVEFTSKFRKPLHEVK